MKRTLNSWHRTIDDSSSVGEVVWDSTDDTAVLDPRTAAVLKLGEAVLDVAKVCKEGTRTGITLAVAVQMRGQQLHGNIGMPHGFLDRVEDALYADAAAASSPAGETHGK